MRVLLISPNMEKLPDPVAPLGMAFLSAALKSQGHEVQCLDLCFVENWGEAIAKAVREISPAVIGISLRNVDNVSYPDTVSYLPFYKEVVRCCREFSSSPIILGGSGFTLLPGVILQLLGADGGIVGEGEEAFSQVLKTIGKDRSDNFEGFCNINGRGVTGAARIADLDALPSPDWDSLDLKKYFDHGGMGNLQSKRGCPFSCIYCTYPLIEGQEVRLRSAQKVVQDVEDLIRRGVKNAFIVDNIFNYPESHAREICRILIEKKLTLQWSCYVHPAFFNKPLAEIMKKAGCTGVEFGTDSGSPAILWNLRKKFTVNDIKQASHAAREAGLEFCHSLSLGAPGETEETLQESFALMEELSPTAVIAMVGLRIFPGTGLARWAEEERGATFSPEDLLESQFYIAPKVRDRIVELAQRNSKNHPNWIFPGLGINVSTRLQSKLRKIGVKGPLWEHMKIMRERRAAKKEPHA
jgi:radical SAM superfamily enzyme YgiQ (UPF0313 family)